MLAEDGSIRRLATTHVDPDKVRWAGLTDAFLPAAGGTGVPPVLRSGEPQLMPRFPRRRSAGDHGTTRASGSARCRLRSAMIVPIRVGRTLGAISFIWARRDGTTSRPRAGLDRGPCRIAVDNAQLYRDAESARRPPVLPPIAFGCMLSCSGIVRALNRRRSDTGPGCGRARPAGVEAIPGWSAAAQRRSRSILSRTARPVTAAGTGGSSGCRSPAWPSSMAPCTRFAT